MWQISEGNGNMGHYGGSLVDVSVPYEYPHAQVEHGQTQHKSSGCPGLQGLTRTEVGVMVTVT